MEEEDKEESPGSHSSAEMELKQRKVAKDENDGGSDDFSEQKVMIEEEKMSTVLGQVTLPYLVAGLGMVAAGLLLDKVQHWQVFVDLPELFIMVPALLGLKGNLEMTLASRLSTHANLGHLDTFSQTVAMAMANLALLQVQGIVVGWLAACLAMGMAWLASPGKFALAKVLVLATSSVVTASLASATLGLVMVLVISASRKLNVNPDNVATPIAAALGDLVTLGLLSFVASNLHATSITVPLAILAIYLLLCPTFITGAKHHPDTREILVNGWTPVLSAMVISSLGGRILSGAVATFPDIAVFQPVINGVAGNLVGIQASRVSTELHRTSRLGRMPKDLEKQNLWSPSITFLPSTSPLLSNNATAARALLFLVVPGHLVFNWFISLSQGFALISPIFMVCYLLAALIQVIHSLFFQNKINLHLFSGWPAITYSKSAGVLHVAEKGGP